VVGKEQFQRGLRREEERRSGEKKISRKIKKTPSRLWHNVQFNVSQAVSLAKHFHDKMFCTKEG
jgi:hypothetical protein